MKIVAKFVLALALAAAASGTATAAPAPAATSGPWATISYLAGGQLVGGVELYCDGNDTSWGNTTTYDSAVWSYFYMCP